MKSFSKRVASFTMAAAMVLSLAAVSPVDAEAATAKITKKSSITAGKTYTYNVKNVTKSQYIKVRMSSGVTVKYNNKTVKKNSTKIKGGKTIALKVKAADKVANYKATVKAVIYNKKNNKKVKTLTTQSTVKCTELKVTDVTVASNSGKYLVATFNKALTKLSVADIEVRKLNTGELKGIEKVELSSDGKTATVALVGSEQSNLANQFVRPNIEYSFSVSQSGAKATTNFTVDAVKAYVTVTGVNSATRTVDYSAPNPKNTNDTAVSGKVTLREDICADDFQDLLGRTVTVWYNRNNVATKLTKADETIIYGAFKYVTSNTATPYYENRATGDKYYVQADSGDVVSTNYINLRANNNVANVNGELVDYAKLVLYSNGNIRTMVYDKTYTDQALVSEVKDTVVYSGTKTAINLKDYLILKDGKTAKVSDLQKDEVVFIDTVNKFADIYTDKKSGDIQAAYTDSFKFMDKVYKFAESTSNYKVQYVDGGIKNLDKDAIASFFKGGPAATVYFDRAGMPVFLSGTKAASAATNTIQLVLTKDVETYNSALVNYLKLTGFDGKETKTYLLPVEELTSIRATDGKTYKTGKSVTANKIVGADEFTVTGFSAIADYNNNPGSEGIKADVDTNADGVVEAAATPLISDLSILKTVQEDDNVNSVVELTLNDAGKVVGLNIKNGAVIKAGTTFDGGKTAIQMAVGNSLQITSGTPVYVSSNNVLSKTTYGNYTSRVADTKVLVYTNDGKNVAYVYVEGTAANNITYYDAVVENITYNADGGKVNGLSIVTGTDKKSYTEFSSDAKQTISGIDAGDIVRVGVAANGTTVESVQYKPSGIIAGKNVSADYVVTTNAINKVNTNEGKFVAASTNVAGAPWVTYEMAKENTTIVLKEVDATGNVKLTAGDLNLLANLGVDNKITFATQEGNVNYVQVIVITKTGK